MDTKRATRWIVSLAIAGILGLIVGCNKEPETETQQNAETVAHGDTTPAATDNDTISRLKAKIESARIREHPPEITITNEQLRAVDPDLILALLASYENDPDDSVRHRAHHYLAHLATVQPVPRIRQEVVRRLLEILYSKNDRRMGTRLMQFQAKDFNHSSKRLIREELLKDQVTSLTVKLCGVANMREELPRLDALITPGADPNHPMPRNHSFQKWYYTFAWDVRLARARMGVKKDIVRCIELAESIEDPEERVIRVLPDIGYIRQPEAIEYLCEYLNSNDRTRGSDDVVPERYASLAMHILAGSIEDYPVKQKLGGGYSDEEIELCRQWMADKTNWKIIH